MFNNPNFFSRIRVRFLFLVDCLTHHGKVDAWRREQSLLRTFQRRPELLEQADLSEQDWKFLERLRSLEDKT